MANHKSALKRIRQTAKKTERNRYYRTRVKNMTKDVLTAVDAGDKAEADKAMKIVNQEFHKYVSKGFFKKETASRRVSRLQTKVNAIA
jgi:small subunit ribosomal protein S20